MTFFLTRLTGGITDLIFTVLDCVLLLELGEVDILIPDLITKHFFMEV